MSIDSYPILYYFFVHQLLFMGRHRTVGSATDFKESGVDFLQTRIQEYRKANKVTQSELADAVGVTRQTIISLENGRYKASLVPPHKIAQFFHVAIEDLFLFDEEEENI